MNKKSLNTKIRLAKALFRLLDTYNFKDITILQLCQEAEITRPSFYRNFTDTKDVVSFACKTLITDMAPMLFVGGPKIDLNFLIKWCNEQKDFLTKLISNDLIHTMIEEIYAYIYPLIMKDDWFKDSEKVADYVVRNASVSVGAFISSIVKNNFEDDEKVIKRSIELVQYLYTEFIY